jgi:hypothetical protein
MQLLDLAKAAGVAIALLAINVLVVVLAVVVYAQLIEPGHPSDFYNKAAEGIAPWCTRTVGVGAFFLVSYLLARRRPDRNGMLFATVFSCWYAIIDAATVGFVGVFNMEFSLSMVANLLAAVGGAYVARVALPRRED